MSKIYVDMREIRNANAAIPAMSSKVGNLKRLLGRLRQNVSEEILGKYNIRKRLKDVYDEIDKIERQMNEIHAVIDSCAEQYSQAEQVNRCNADEFK